MGKTKSTAKAVAEEAEVEKKPKKTKAAKKDSEPTAEKTTTKKTASVKKQKIESTEKAQAFVAVGSTPAAPSFQENSEAFDSNKISLTVTKKAQCRIEFSVHTKPFFMKEARAEALKNLAKEVSIPGFRKGKAPTTLLEKRFPDSIKEETLKALANAAWVEAQNLSHCFLSNKNGKIDYELKHADFEKGCDFFYAFEADPIVPEIDFSQLKIDQVDTIAVDDKKIDETIQQIREFYTSYKKINDRAVKEEDFVLLDIDNMDSDVPSRVFSSMRFRVNRQGMATWLLEMVIGMLPGEVKEGISKPNEEDSDQIKQEFQPKKVKVTLNSIEEMELPPIDDDLAKKVGTKNVEEMRSRLEVQLNKKAEFERREEMRNKISDALIAHIHFEIPKSIKESEFSHRFKQAFKNPSFKQEWEQKNRVEQEQMQYSIMQDSEKAIRLFYISRAIAERNRLRISLPHENKERASSMLEAMFSYDQDMLHYESKSEEEKAFLMSKLLLQKAQDFALEKCGLV